MELEQKPVEYKSVFTKDADIAFDEFCKKFFNPPNRLMNPENKIDNQFHNKTKNLSLNEPKYSKISSNIIRIYSDDKILNSKNVNTISAGCLDDLMSYMNTNFNKASSKSKNLGSDDLDKSRSSLTNVLMVNSSISHSSSSQNPPPRPPPTYLKETRNKKYVSNNNSPDNFINKNIDDFNLNQEQIAFNIPKKNAFKDEFFLKPKLTIPTSFLNDQNNLKTKIFQDFDIKPYVINSDEQKMRLGLRVVSCGMNKKFRLPIPRSNFVLDRGNFGDDAGFVAENMFGDAFGIADGATGNFMLGYDPGDFSRSLMQTCSEIFSEKDKIYDAKSLLLEGYEKIQDKTCYGSCTACVVTLNHTNNVLTAANVGDTGYFILRNGEIFFQSIPQRITFECPRQLDSYPWKQDSRKMGVSYTEIVGKDTQLEKFEVKKDDWIILSSDGLFDNLDPYEIKEICLKVFNSNFFQ